MASVEIKSNTKYRLADFLAITMASSALLIKSKIPFLSRVTVSLVLISVLTPPVMAATDPGWSASISQQPVGLREGQTVTFSAPLFVRHGTARSVRIIGGVDSTRILDKTFNLLPEGTQQTMRFRWRAKPGTHSAWFEIDPDEQTIDSYRGNNRTELSLTVAPLNKAYVPVAPPTARQKVLHPQDGAALSDIVVLNTRIINAGSGGKFRPGDRLHVEVDLKNEGQADTGVFYVQLRSMRYEISGGARINGRERLLKKPIKNLVPDENYLLIFDVGVEHRENIEYVFELKADYNNRVIEFKEDNNDRYVGSVDFYGPQ